MAGMELRLTARRGENLLVILVIPVVVLVFFSSVGVVDTGPGRRVEFVLPGVLALAIISTSLVNLGIATAYERSYGVLKRLGGTPLPVPGLVAAKTLAVGAIEIAQIVLVVVIGVAVLGWKAAPGASPGLVVSAFVLGTAAFAGLGLLMAGTLRAEATLAGANGLYVCFLLLGGIVVPVDRLPGPVSDVARLLPASALAETWRIGLGSARGDATGPLAVLAVWALVAVALAATRFRWD
jgi:ABC-2 type transport system permease protein